MLGDSRARQLTKDLLDRFPVWSDDESRRFKRPVLDPEPLPDDLGKLFIRATFQTPQAVTLPGYVIESAGVYSVAIFANNRKFQFNMNAGSLAPKMMAELLETLERGEIQIFPLRYETEHHFRDEPNIAGVFDVSDSPRGT